MKRETKVKIVQIVVGTACAVAVGSVITAAVKGLIPVEDMTKINKVIFRIGTGILVGMAMSAAADYGTEFVGDCLNFDPESLKKSAS